MKSLSRRRALKTLFCSSAAMTLNLQPQRTLAQAAQGGLNFLAIGDFGSGAIDQKKVAKGLQDYAAKISLKPDALFFIGDNFYGPAHPMPKVNGKTVKGESAPFTPASKRWKTDIEDMYPASAFPGPQYAILGNHDYHDNKGGEKTQLAYAQQAGVRWQMPSKWYRQDFGGDKPVLTVLFVDTNLREVSGKDTKTKKYTKACLAPDEEKAQHEWLKAELAKPRAPFTLVVGHHPLYSNGDHGDTKPLIAAWDSLFQEQKVHAYLCGHDHDLQHLELEGKFTSHILSGGGGAKTRKLKTPKRKMPYGKDVYGFTHISVQADALTFAHHGADGGLLHQFTKRLDGKIQIKG
jgi:tartrate-resistant acid phosphatase type 5